MFHERLKQARKKAKLSQEQVALIINTSRSNISKYETGYGEPNIDTLRELCKLYKVSADFLLEIEDNEFTDIANNNIQINQENNGNTTININN